jgi:hypothetical protein
MIFTYDIINIALNESFSLFIILGDEMNFTCRERIFNYICIVKFRKFDEILISLFILNFKIK